MMIPKTLLLPRFRGVTFEIHILLLGVIGWFVLGHAAGDRSSLIALSAALSALTIHGVTCLCAARCLRLPVSRLILFPFGSVALFSSPQTLLVIKRHRLAAPIVNMAFAVGSALLHNDVIGLDDRSTEFAQFFSRYNLTLALLNLLPFPPFNTPAHAAKRADSSGKSERIARCDWRAGIVCSVVLLIVGVAVTDPIALTAACAVGTATVRAAARSRTTALLGATVAGEVMTKIGDIPSLPHGATVRAIIPEVLRSQHGVFRVCHRERTLGFTFREDLIEGAISGEDMYVCDLLDRELTTVASTLPLEEILDVVMAGYNDPLLVADGEAVVGLIFREQLVEFVLVRNAAGSPAAAAERD